MCTHAHTWWATWCAASYRGKNNGQHYADDYFFQLGCTTRLTIYNKHAGREVICFNSRLQDQLHEDKISPLQIAWHSLYIVQPNQLVRKVVSFMVCSFLQRKNINLSQTCWWFLLSTIYNHASFGVLCSISQSPNSPSTNWAMVFLSIGQPNELVKPLVYPMTRISLAKKHKLNRY